MKNIPINFISKKINEEENNKNEILKNDIASIFKKQELMIPMKEVDKISSEIETNINNGIKSNLFTNKTNMNNTNTKIIISIILKQIKKVLKVIASILLKLFRFIKTNPIVIIFTISGLVLISNIGNIEKVIILNKIERIESTNIAIEKKNNTIITAYDDDIKSLENQIAELLEKKAEKNSQTQSLLEKNEQRILELKNKLF